MTKPSLATPWIYLILLYATVILLYPVILTRDASFFIKQDNLHQAYPFYNKLAISLHKGYLPVWDANTFGGKSFAGELQAGIFYPINIVWCLLFGSAKGIDTYRLDLLVAFHYLISLFGMYNLARAFRLTGVGCIVAALIYTFAGSVGARAAGQTCIFFGLTLLPWSVYFVASYYFRRMRRRYIVWAGLIAGLEILAGHMQPFFHTILIDGTVIVCYEYRNRQGLLAFAAKAAVNILLIICFALLIAIPQVYYSAEYMARCLRTVSGGVYIGPGEKVPLYIYSHWFIIQLANLGNFLGQRISQPDDDNILYMGVLPLFLVVGYFTWYRHNKPSADHAGLTKLLTIILIVGGLSALGYLTFFYLFLYEIPFVNLIRQLGRYSIMISFSLSLLTGLAVSQLGSLRSWFWQNMSQTRHGSLLFLALNSLLWAFISEKDIPLSVSLPFLLTFSFLLSLPLIKKVQYLSAVAVAIIFVDLLLNPVGFLPTQTSFYPDHFYGRNRIIDSLEKTYGKYRVTFDMKDYDQTRRNLGDLYSIQTKFGYGATINKEYSDFINTDQGSNKEINDLLNVRYVITDKKLDSNYIYRDSVERLKLYERRNWYPRCYWKRQLGLIGMEIERQNANCIRQLTYTDNYQRMTVKCLAADTLIFSENDYPGWRCFDNGKQIRISRPTIRNYPPLFRSIALGRGNHIIEFLYIKVFRMF